MIVLPRSKRGRRSAAQEEVYQAELEAFAAEIMEIDYDVISGSALAAGVICWNRTAA